MTSEKKNSDQDFINRVAAEATITPAHDYDKIPSRNAKAGESESVVFTCTICGLLKLDRSNPTGRYCRECYNGYVSFRGKIRRKNPYAKVTMDMYRDYREHQGLPMVPAGEVQRGRPSQKDPNDIRQMTYIEFWKHVSAVYEEIMPGQKIVVYIGAGMMMVATPKGLRPLHEEGLKGTLHDIDDDGLD